LVPATLDSHSRSGLVSGGQVSWGVEPPVAYLPAALTWREWMPAWLHERRDEVIAVLESLQHVVDDVTM